MDNKRRRHNPHGAYVPRYNRESVARQLYEPAPYQPAPRSVPQRRRIVAVKKQSVLVKDVQERVRNHILSYAVILAFFGGLASILAVGANVSYAHMRLEAANSQLATITASNAARQGEINANLTHMLPYIEYIAINELGMVRPESFQRMTVQAPRQAYTATTHDVAAITTGFSLSRFWEMIR